MVFLKKIRPQPFYKSLKTTYSQEKKRIARYKFSQRSQRMGESFDNFLKDLHILDMDCEYTDTDDMLVDNIVRGIYHKKVQERLLDKGQELTLDAAIQVASNLNSHSSKFI